MAITLNVNGASATGKRLRDLPFTPARVNAALA